MSLHIIRGAKDTDELSKYGDIAANRYYKAKTVFLIDKEDKVHFSKGDEHPLEPMEYFELEDDLNEFSLIMQKIYFAYKEAHPDTWFGLAHGFVGQWLFNRPIKMSNNRYEFAWEAMHRKNLDSLRESADDFIEHDFGMSSEVVLNNDGTSKKSHEATNRILDADRERDATSTDSAGVQSFGKDS